MANDENTSRVVNALVFTDKENNETWTFDFNRLAIKRICSKPELAKALDITEEIGTATRLAMWGLYMPEIMSIAVIMNHAANALPVTKAEELYGRIPNSRKPEFCARIAELFIARVSEMNGLGNEDAVEDDAGNVDWE